MKIYPYDQDLAMYPGVSRQYYIPDQGIIFPSWSGFLFSNNEEAIEKAKEATRGKPGIEVPDDLVAKVVKTGVELIAAEDAFRINANELHSLILEVRIED